jgi:hypothetical protein
MALALKRKQQQTEKAATTDGEGVSFQVDPTERYIISCIASRAKKIDPEINRLSTEMDLVATHANGCPLDLEALHEADDFNLMHDIYGIARHIDRSTGKLENFFLPRLRLRNQDSAAS